MGRFFGKRSRRNSGKSKTHKQATASRRQSRRPRSLLIEPLEVRMMLDGSPWLQMGSPLQVNEGAYWEQQISICDGVGRTFAATVDYGDGAGVQWLAVDNQNQVCLLSHTYADNKSDGSAYSVQLSLYEDGSEVASQTLDISVLNVAPNLPVLPDQSFGPGVTQVNWTSVATFSDVGFGDGFANCFINWGDNTPNESCTPILMDGGGVGTPRTACFGGFHAYEQAGDYTVTVGVGDDDGATTTRTFVVHLTPASGIDAGGPYTVAANRSVVLTASAWGTANGVNWDLDGDGVFGESGSDAQRGDESGANPSFSAAGLMVGATCQVTAAVDGHTDSATVTVVDAPLQANAGGPYFVPIHGQIQLDGTGSTAPSGATLQYQWSWCFGNGQTVTSTAAQPVFSAAPVDGECSVAVTLTVTAGGSSSTATTTVSVQNAVPVVNVGGDVVRDGKTFSLLRDVSFVDPGDTDGWTVSVCYGDSALWEHPLVGPGGSFRLEHGYSTKGSYRVRVRVQDTHSAIGEAGFNVLVGDIAPIARPGGPYRVDEGSIVQLDGSASSDVGNNIVSYLWDLDEDGVFGETGEVGQKVTFHASTTITDDVQCTVSLRVTDLTALSSTASTTVTMRNLSPVVDAGGPYCVQSFGSRMLAGTVLRGALNCAWDLDGDGIFGEEDWHLVSPGWTDEYDIWHSEPEYWDGGQWGDERGPVVTFLPRGMFSSASWQVAFRARDSVGYVEDTATVSIVPNSAPTLNVSVVSSATEGATVTWTGQIDDADSSSWTGSIDFGDGQSESIYPTLDGTFVVSHCYADEGDRSVVIAVTDDGGLSGDWQSTLAVANAAPTLTVVGNRVVRGQQVSIADIGSFTDPGTTDAFMYTINWGDGTVDTAPATVDAVGSGGGSLVGSFDGNHQYVAYGTYCVTLTVADEDGGAASQSFTLTVIDAFSPYAVIGGPTSLEEGASITLYSASWTPSGAIASCVWDLDGDGVFGEVGRTWVPWSWVEGWTDYDNWIWDYDEYGYCTGGHYAWIPGYWTGGYFDGTGERGDERGEYVSFSAAGLDGPMKAPVSLRVVNDTGLSDTATVTLAITNAAPLPWFGGFYGVTEGQQVTLDSTGSSDPGNDVVDWIWRWTAANGQAIEKHGAQVQFEADGYNGPLAVPVTLTVVDSAGAQSTFSGSVQVGNQTPAINLGADYYWEPSLRLRRVGTFVDYGTGLWTATVDYGDGSGIQPLAIAPDRTFLLDHTYMARGDYRVRVWVRDEDNAVGEGTFLSHFCNLTPTAVIGGPTTVDEGQSITLSGLASTDPGNNIVSYTWDLDQDGVFGEANEIGPTVTFAAPSQLLGSQYVNVALRVVDAGGLSSATTAWIFVHNTGPIAEAGGPYRVYQGWSVTLDASASQGATWYEWDLDGDGIYGEANRHWVDEHYVYHYDEWGNFTYSEWVAGQYEGGGDRGDEWGANPTFSAVGVDPGVYTVWLVAHDNDGQDSDPAQITVFINAAPIVTVEGPVGGNEGTRLVWTGAVNDPESPSWTGWVDYGDGYGEPLLIGADRTFALTHAYADHGDYTISLNVTDDGGLIGTSLLSVSIANVLPVLVVAGSQRVRVDEELNLAEICRFVDPGWNDTFGYTIDWGDGNSTSNLPVVVPGSADVPVRGTFPGQHTYTAGGNYTVTVMVEDGSPAGHAVATIAVHVFGPGDPQAKAGSYSVDEGGSVLLDAGQSTVGADRSIVEYAWDLDGDGVYGEEAQYYVPSEFHDAWVEDVTLPGYYRQVVVEAAHYGDVYHAAYTETITVPGHEETVWVEAYDEPYYLEQWSETVAGSWHTESAWVDTSHYESVSHDPWEERLLISDEYYDEYGIFYPAVYQTTLHEGYTETVWIAEGHYEYYTVVDSWITNWYGGYWTTRTVAAHSETRLVGEWSYTVDHPEYWEYGVWIPDRYAEEWVPPEPGTVLHDGYWTEGYWAGGGERGDERGSAVWFSTAGRDGPQTIAVGLRITDSWGNCDYDTATIEIRNTAPTAVLVNNGPLPLGGAAVVRFTGMTDLSTDDVNAGFHYSYATNPAELADCYETALDGESKGFSLFGLGEHTIFGRIFDRDGGYTTYSTVVVVRDLPSLATAGDLNVTAGEAFTQDALATFVAPTSSTSVYQYRIHWDDVTIEPGTPTVQQCGSLDLGTFGGSHCFATPGDYVVMIELTNEASASQPVWVAQYFTVHVQAAPPRVLLTGVETGATASVGAPLSVAGSLQGFPTGGTILKVSYGDGSSDATVSCVGASFLLNHTYLALGVYQVSLTATNSAGQSATASFFVRVAAARPTINLGPIASTTQGSPFTRTGSFTANSAAGWTGLVDYGDGSTPSTLALSANRTFTLAHTYDKVGQHWITVWLTDATGTTTSQRQQVTVANRPPAPVISGAANVALNAAYVLTLDAHDSGDSSITWRIHWGDGSPVETFTGNSGTLTHRFTQGGLTRTITATASDDGVNDFASNGITVAVAPPSPALAITHPGTLDANGFYSLGQATVGAPLCYSFTIRNNGQGPLTLGALAATDTTIYMISSGGVSIAPYQQTTVTLAIIVPTVGDFTSDVTLCTNDPAYGAIRFRVVGQGVASNITSPTVIVAASGQTLFGVVLGDLTGLTAQVDVDDDLYDGSGVVHVQVNSNDRSFIYDPWVGGRSGSVTLPYRLVLIEDSTQAATVGYSASITVDLPSATTVPTIPAEIVSARLAKPGTDSNPLTTCNPVVEGDLNRYYAASVRIEFDHNADGNADGSVECGLNATSFSYDPRRFDAAFLGRTGPVALNYRLVARDASGTVVYTSAWDTFSYALIAAPSATRTVTLTLKNPPPQGSTSTSDPEVSGKVMAAGKPVANANVEFDLDGDGLTDRSVSTNGQGEFSWKPTTLNYGTIAIRARTTEWNSTADVTVFSNWTNPLTFTYAARPMPLVTALSLAAAATGGDTPTTADPTLVGTVANSDLTGLEVEVDFNNDGQADTSVSLSANDNFTVRPVGLKSGSITVKARTARFDTVSGGRSHGDWRSLTFTYQPYVAPTIATLGLANVTGQADGDGVPTSAEAVLSGGLAGSAANVKVVFERLAADGTYQTDGETRSDASGQFTYTPVSMSLGRVTFRAHTVVIDTTQSQGLLGAYRSFSFNYAPAAAATAAVSQLALVATTGALDVDNLPITADPRLTGKLTGSSVSNVFVLIDRQDATGDWTTDGYAQTDSTGVFSYRPGSLAAGDDLVTFRARAIGRDADYGLVVYGTERTMSFHYNPSSGVLVSAGLVDVQLAGGSNSTANAVLSGQISGLTSPGYVTVQFDFNGDGIYDATTTTDSAGSYRYQPAALGSGQVSVRARVQEWDDGRQQYLVGAWSAPLTVAPAATAAAPAVASLALVSPMGGYDSDGKRYTSNALLAGSLSGVLDRPLLIVELSFDGGATIAQTLSADSLGKFHYEPTCLNYGLVSVSARATWWNPTAAAFDHSAWRTTSFHYRAPTGLAPTVASLGFQNDLRTTSYPYPIGSTPDLTGQVRSEGALADVFVEFDLDNDNAANHRAACDEMGKFSLTGAGLQYGGNTVRARAVQYDAATGQTRVGAWSTYTLYYCATPTISGLELVSITESPATDRVTTNANLRVNCTSANYWYGRVEFDYPGVTDATRSLAASSGGMYLYTPVNLPAGAVTVRARAVSVVTTGVEIAGPWQSISFIYAPPGTDPATLHGTQTARTAYDTEMNSAQGARDAAVTAADTLYQQAKKAADAAYAVAMQAAYSSYVTSLAQFSGDKTSANIEFVWPTAPGATGVALPDDSTQTRPPAAPTYDGPVFNPESDSIYKSASNKAKAEYQQAVNKAESDYANAKKQADDQYDWTVWSAELSRYTSCATAYADYQAALDAVSANPLHSPTEAYDACMAGETYAWQDYNERVAKFDATLDGKRLDAEETCSAHIEKALQTRNSAQSTADADFSAAEATAEQKRFDDCEAALAKRDSGQLTQAEYEAAVNEAYATCQETIDDAAATRDNTKRTADQTYDDTCSTEHSTCDTAINKAQRERDDDVAKALAEAYQFIADANEVYARALAANEKDAATRRAEAQQEYDEALAQATRDLAKDKADAVEDRDNALADAAKARRLALATATTDRWGKESAAKQASLGRWQARNSGPWADYQAALVAHEAAYVAAIVTATTARATAEANAYRNEAGEQITAEKAEADQNAAAAYTRDCARAQAARDLTVAAASLQLTRANDDAASFREAQHKWAKADRDRSIDSNAAWETYNNNADAITHDWGSPVSSDQAWRTLTKAGNAAQAKAATSAATIQRDLEKAVCAHHATYLTALADLQESYEASGDEAKPGLAEAEAAYADALAENAAIRVKANADAALERADYVASAEKEFADKEAERCRIQSIADATSYQGFRNDVVADYVVTVHAWSDELNTPWSGYQSALANAEQARIQNLGLASVEYATTVATAKYTWSTGVDQAQETAANDMALARHTRDTDLANCRLAADQQATTARLDYARDMAAAITRHDQGTVKRNQEYDGTVVDRQLQYQTDVIVADKTYDNARADDPNSQSAHAAWQTSVNQATAGRTTDLATARQGRATDVAKLDAGLVWQRTTAAERQADTVAQSARGLAEAEKGIQVAYATATADATYAQALTIAAQDKAETDTLAAADRKYNLDACDAASSYASAVAKQRANYQAAWYQAKLTAVSTAIQFTVAPSCTYHHDVVAAGAAWAEGVKAAVVEYQDGLFNAAHANQVRLNAAAQRQTDADSTAQKTYDDAQALIDRNWSIAVDTAWATREAGRAVVEANAAEDRILAQGRYDRALADADQKFQVDLAAKSVEWASSVATAQRGYNPANWQAYNNSVATADQQLSADRRAAASARAGRVGQAQIDLATGQGQVQVDRVSARNAVEIDYVKAMNTAASDQSLWSGVAQVLLTTAQAGSAAVYTVAVAQSQVALVAATNTIEATYQRKLADADVGRAHDVAAAEGAFEIAELDRKVASTSEWAARAGASEADQLRAAATAARRQWLDATKPYYVAYVTAQARASADYQNDLAAARRGASAQQAAADVVYASSTAAAAQARAIGAAGSASGFAGREVILSNAYDLAYAQAEAAFRMTYAKAEKAKAVTLATAEKAYQVTLVGLDPQATNYQTTVDTAQKARAVKQAEATRDWTCAQAGADEGWSIGIAKADEAYSKGWAERTYDETVADAKRDGAYGVLVAQAGSVRDVAYAQAQAGLWNQATTLDNARQTRLAAAEVAWRDEQYTAQVSVTTTLASTSATPWAAFQRDLALAQQSWWTTTGTSYTASVANANLAATAYQTLVSAAYVVKAQLLATLDLNAAKAQAADNTKLVTAQAQANKDYQDSVATAQRAFLVAKAESQFIEDNTTALVLCQAVADPTLDLFAALDNAHAAHDLNVRDATRGFRAALASAEGKRGVDLAQATIDDTTANLAPDRAWQKQRAATENAFAAVESIAYQTLSLATGALDTAYRRQAAQSQKAAVESLSQSDGTPWSALEAARAAALSDWIGGTTGASDIRRTSVATAQVNLESRQAAADAAFTEGYLQKFGADALKEAQASLTAAQAKAATLAAKVASGEELPPTPDETAKPSVADIVPAAEPNSAAYTAPVAKFDAASETFGLASAPGTVPGYYGYGWNGYGWNGWWGCYGWWYASWWNGGYWYGWYGDGLTESVVRPESIDGEQARAPAEMSSIVPRISNGQTPTILLLGGGLSPTSLFSDDSAAPHLYEVCFAAGTLVLMADGSRKPIETVRPGEFVLAVSQHAPEGQSDVHCVREVYHNPPQPLCEVRAGDSVIRTTANHPFYVRGRGFVAVAELQPGDSLRSAAGRWVEVAEVMRTDEVQPVFNLQVADAHTYFVAAGEDDDAVLVHNESPAQLIGREEVLAAIAKINEQYTKDRAKVIDGLREQIRETLYDWKESLPPDKLAQYAYRALAEANARIANATTPEEKEELRLALVLYEEALGGWPFKGEKRLEVVISSLVVIREHDLKVAALVTQKQEIWGFIAKHGLQEPTEPFDPVSSRYLFARGAAELGMSCLPGAGELMDLALVCDSEAPLGDRALAAVSLAGNFLVVGLAPNYGVVAHERRLAHAIKGEHHFVEVAREEAAQLKAAASKASSWPWARQRFWKDLAAKEAQNPSGWFSKRNLIEMAEGRAPKMRVEIKNRITGKIEVRDISLELHHRTLPQRVGSGAQHEAWNLEIVNRWAHEGMDEYRHAGWELIKILNGPNSW